MAPASDARSLAHSLMQYRQPDTLRAIAEIAVSLVPFVALWVLMWSLIEINYLLVLVIAVPAAGLLVRIFMIQHDCGHGSYFRYKKANDWVGRIAGVLTFTPYSMWRRVHALHHANSGNLDKRGFGDVHTLTVDEYRSKTLWGRLTYRLYRNPLVMFGIGPAFLFLFQHRLPVGMMRAGWQPWISSMGTNLSILVFCGVLVWLVGLKTFVLIHGPIVLIAASVGVWLFFVQHQFEDTVWDNDDDWNWHHAALHGSSHYDLPRVLHWFTANIGLHHVHHLCSRIPFYSLQRVLRDHPELRDVSTVTLAESLACVRLVLWDSAQRRLVTFREANSTS